MNETTTPTLIYKINECKDLAISVIDQTYRLKKAADRISGMDVPDDREAKLEGKTREPETILERMEHLRMTLEKGVNFLGREMERLEKSV